MFWKPVSGNKQLYENGVCQLKVIETDSVMQIWINYRGYNIVEPMMIWEFFAEPQELEIEFHIDGDSSKNRFITVNKEDFPLFADLIYLFLTENDADRMISPDLAITKWP